MRYQVKYRIWLEKDGKFLLGEGSALLLSAIDETGSLSLASKKTGISYKKAWQIIKDIETLTGEKLIISKKGGAHGGGTVLTREGKTLLEEYKKLEKRINNCLKNGRDI